MISRRNKRPASPQERPKQFAINNSSGMDVNKPSTDAGSVHLLKNLTVNLDGSVSLRKRIRPYAWLGTGCTVICPLPIDNHYLVRTDADSLEVRGTCTNTAVSVNVTCRNYFYPDEYLTGQASQLAWLTLDDACAPVQTGTSTILNGTVDTAALVEALPNLSKAFPEHLPESVARYIKISKDSSSSNVLQLEIMQPEITVLNGAEGAITLNPNMTADYPYAIRDVYGSAAEILGILPYTKFRLNEDNSHAAPVYKYTETREYEVLNAITQFSNTSYKAFCKIPNTESGFKCSWQLYYKGDAATGFIWDNPYASGEEGHVLNEMYSGDPDDELGSPTSMYTTVNMSDFYRGGPDEQGTPDIFTPPNTVGTGVTPPNALRPSKIRFTIYDAIPTPVYVTADDGSQETINVYTVLDTQTLDLPYASDISKMHTELPNAALGRKLYYKKSLYSFGTSAFNNFAYVSDPDSTITPMYNILDLDVRSGATVSKLAPWRDYLLAFTTSSVHLVSRLDSGFTSKTISTDVGVSLRDADTVRALLNGVMFKSGPKVYLAYPNVYSGDDTYLSLTDVSKPIAEILTDLDATVTSNWTSAVHSDKYVLFAPDNSRTSTHCLQYDAARKSWEYYNIPIYVHSAYTTADGALIANGGNALYVLFETYRAPADVVAANAYRDTVYGSDGTLVHLPIEFELDTGSKTDNLTTVKQFVESRILISTEDDAEIIPIHVTVAIDGDPHISTIDVNTDAPFWKVQDSDGDYSKGVAGTTFRLTTGDGGDAPFGRQSSGILRQLSLRYSGRGRAVRHILTGVANSNFKLYEIYIKYKPIRY